MLHQQRLDFTTAAFLSDYQKERQIINVVGKLLNINMQMKSQRVPVAVIIKIFITETA